MSSNSPPGGMEGNATDAIMLLLKKHPFISICFGCLALYGLSMGFFIQRYVKKMITNNIFVIMDATRLFFINYNTIYINIT